jgi:hypothetical protein
MFPADGTPHVWTFDYDPVGAGDLAEMTFKLDGKAYTATLNKGHKAEGAIFKRFGIMNVQNSGGSMTAWIDDVEIDGVREEFSTDPAWEGTGNRTRFNDCDIRPFHIFWCRRSSFAGDEPGEVGGLMWRVEATRPQEAG